MTKALRLGMFAAAVTAGCGGVAAAQAPPMKMGLWETTTVTTTKVPAQMPALASMNGTSTDKRQTCIGPGDWEKAMGAMKEGLGCTVSRKPMGSGFALDWTCKNDSTTTVAHMEMVIEAMVKMNGTVHSTMTAPSLGKGEVVVDGKSESHFVSADCGTVPPGKSVEKQ